MTRQNVVVIVTDDQTFYDRDVMTYLESRPHGHWVDFPRSYVSIPVCGPSRGNLFTGRYGFRTGIVDNRTCDLIIDHGTLAEPLQASGYHTAMIGKFINRYPWDRSSVYQPPGWHKWASHQPGNSGYYEYVWVEDGVRTVATTNPEDYITDRIRDRTVSFIETAREPFFIHQAHWGPHELEIPAARHDGLYDAAAITRRPNFNPASIDDKPAWLRAKYPTQRTQAEIDNYDGKHRNAWEALEAIDECIEATIDALDDKGCLDRTVIVFVSDNGYGWLEHRANSKGAPYEEITRAAMMVRWPGVTQRTSQALTSTVDIAPTVADIAGIALDPAPDGMSLRPMVDGTLGDDQWRDAAFMEWHENDEYPAPDWSCIRTDRWKWVELGTGERELYDLDADPYEQTNLAGTEPTIETQMSTKLARIISG